MSKRATDAAWQLYPDYPSMDGGYVTQREQRELVMKGYEQAEKDIIERAVAWLKEHAEDYVFTCLGKEKLQSRLWDDLKQAMEEKK
jgi:hypothetical protein